MRSGNDEAALTRLEARVGSSALSDVVRGLIGILHGEDNGVYWANLSLKFSEAGRQNLREQAGKIPSAYICDYLFYLGFILCSVYFSIR